MEIEKEPEYYLWKFLFPECAKEVFEFGVSRSHDSVGLVLETPDKAKHLVVIKEGHYCIATIEDAEELIRTYEQLISETKKAINMVK